MTEIVKHTPTLTPIDGFDDYGNEPSANGADYVKFDAATQTLWHGRDGAAMYRGPYIAVNCLIELLCWSDKRVVDRIVQKPGEPLPDVDELNNAVPQVKWETDFNGNPRGPWQKNYTIFLVDPKTGSKIIVSNSTVGQRIAYEHLKERVLFMRKLRGGTVYPEVMLSSKSMRTKFGMKLRPDFEIIEWRTLGGSSAPALAAPPVNPLPAVAKPAPAEIIRDELPVWDKPIPGWNKPEKNAKRPVSVPEDPDSPFPA